MLDRVCPHEIDELAFVQQSHNATVFKGSLDGQAAFFKSYELGDATKWTQGGIDEAEAASDRMIGYGGGVARLLWASVPDGIIVTTEVPGRLAIDVLDTPDIGEMLGEVGRWLRAYVGDTAFNDRFSTSYWVRRRQAVDLSVLGPKDRQLAADLLNLQGVRAETLGTISSWKGQAPRDFAPWNLHWTGDVIWGFDLEGHVAKSLAQVAARFSVLVVEQSQGVAGPDVLSTTATQLRAAFSDCEDPPQLMPFVLGDLLFERFVKWADHDVKRPKLRRAIEAHLATG